LKLLRVINRYRQTITLFKAYSYRTLLWQALELPYDYYLRSGRSSLPINITLFITLRCNAMCSFCNLKQILNTRVREMTLDEIKEFINHVKSRKPSFILFGGEPFLRKDILGILEAVKSAGLTCGIFTNGLALPSEKIKELVKLKLDYVAFSLQGNEQVHDKLYGVRGAYSRLMEALEFFAANRGQTSVIIHSTLSKDNVSHLDHLFAIRDRLKLNAVRVGHPTYFTHSELNKNSIFCNKYFQGEDVSLLGGIDDTWDDSDVVVKAAQNLIAMEKNNAYFTPDLDEAEIRSWYSPEFKSTRRCLFVYRGVFIYPNGDVFPCESYHYKMGNILEQNLAEIWNNDKYVKFRRLLKNELSPGCARCCKI
jgi:MoaA/NifB/PqqE/SkfB family radical SAM enzyme